MATVAELAHARQQQLINITDAARSRALRAWRQMDFRNLDLSWAQIGPTITAEATQAQLQLAQGSDRFTSQVSTQYQFTQDKAAIVPEAFAAVDGEGRDAAGLLFGAVTTTKKTIGAGFGADQSLQAGATYLAAMLKTIVADLARSADKVSGAGKGYTHYVRVVNGSACSRCAILAGISSGADAFLRHVSCQCSAVPIPGTGKSVAKGLYDSPQGYFDSLTSAEQDRIFTADGAEAIRSGADVQSVVNARRGARGIGYSSHGGTRQLGDPVGHFEKTTIGYRPDGSPVQIYTTTEGTTVRGSFGRAQQTNSAMQLRSGARYVSTSRVRLMPESIMKIAGNDTALRQAFLRDAGYMQNTGRTGAEIIAQQRADRILVNRATLKFDNFTLG